MVIPTAGNRPWLPAIVEAADCPVVVILTADVELDLPAKIVYDLGPPNIARWWNRGIDAAASDHVGLFNDDITIDRGLPQRMSDRLTATGAALCVADRHSRLTGWAFMIDRRHVRPDETFWWWYSDNDLLEQAYYTRGVCNVDGGVEHHSAGEFVPLAVNMDRQLMLYQAKWGVRASTGA